MTFEMTSGWEEDVESLVAPAVDRIVGDLQAALEVVLHRASHGLVQGQRAAQRFLILVHALQVAPGPLFTDVAFNRFTGHCTSADRQRQQAGAEQLLTSFHPWIAPRSRTVLSNGWFRPIFR